MCFLFQKFEELNKKESPVTIQIIKFKTQTTKDSIKIFGNPHLKIKKNCYKKYLKIQVL